MMSLCSRRDERWVLYCLFTSTISLSQMLAVKLVFAHFQITVAVEAQGTDCHCHLEH